MQKMGTRKIDDFGRASIPIEVRRALGIGTGDNVEFFVDIDKNCIIIEKYNDSCIFCNSDKDLKEFNTRHICKECASKISKLR